MGSVRWPCCKLGKRAAHQYFLFLAVLLVDRNSITSLFQHEYQPHADALTGSWTSRYLLQTDVPVNGKMFEIPPLGFLCAIWEEHFFSPSVLPLPKPHLLSGHLKFIKWDWMITLTHSAFDLLSLNYHKAAQRRTSLRLRLCAAVIASLIFFFLEVRNRYSSSSLISLYC